MADGQESQQSQGDNDETTSQDGEELEQLPEGKDTFSRAEMQKVRAEAAKNRVRAREAEKLFEAYGGKESALAVLEATRSTEGLTRLFVEAGQAIGLPKDKVVSMLTGGEPPDAGNGAPGGDDDADDDKPLTKKQVKELMAEFERRVDESVKKPLETRREMDLARAGEQLVYDLLEAEKITGKEQLWAIKFIEDHAPQAGDPDEFSPGRIKEAVKAGIADYREWQEETGRRYLENKEKGRQAPAPVSGSSSGTLKVPKEPKDVDEAIEIANQLLGQEA